jgi:hypothetical protein
MDEAAGAAAADIAENERGLIAASQELERLTAKWGHACLIGHDENGYWAAPPKAGKGLLRADTADELDQKCAAEFAGGPS